MAAGRARLEAIACVIEDMGRMLAQEYGQPIRDGAAPAHSPARLPYIERVELEPAASATIDLEARLGKPANRGHLANLGAEAVLVQFVGLRGDELSAAYELAPAAVLDMGSWITRRVRLVASSATAAEVEADAETLRRVQILAQ
jgi:hypothetical protein